MARKRGKNKAKRPESATEAPVTEAAVEAAPVAPGPPKPPTEELGLWERFWTRPLHPLRFSLFRFFFFACVAFESFFDLEHAPRYGAGGFNVPHFDVLTALPVPSRHAMVVLLLVQFALALRVAFGLGQRVTVWALTAVYGYTYFISQLDSYQHHYMVFLFLVLMSLVDWESERPRTWPVHLVIVQTCIVYFWAGVTKVHPLWTDGTLLGMQVGRDFAEQVPIISSFGAERGMMLMANYAMCMEFGVPLLILWAGLAPDGRLRETIGWLAVLIGLPLHAGIEFAGLKIGLFSYMMMAFYLLVVPDRFYRWLDTVAGGLGAVATRLLAQMEVPPLRDVYFVVGLAFTGLAVWHLPLEFTGAAALAVSAVALASEWPVRPGRAQRAITHVLVGLTVLYAAASSETMRKYWYYLGGDARRRGDVTLAIYGYSNTAAVDPEYESAYLRWAMMLDRANRHEEARDALEQGVAHVPDPSFDLYEALALSCDRLGDRECARQAAAHAITKKQDPRMQGIFDKR
ncbi:MAG: hypothetical protein EP330_08895 [Deltaproteobacteria bacterium]|nr:MAG: hypothetical protein EP330_08895 [Deltaproteobacteria bacterium]